MLRLPWVHYELIPDQRDNGSFSRHIMNQLNRWRDRRMRNHCQLVSVELRRLRLWGLVGWENQGGTKDREDVANEAWREHRRKGDIVIQQSTWEDDPYWEREKQGEVRDSREMYPSPSSRRILNDRWFNLIDGSGKQHDKRDEMASNRYDIVDCSRPRKQDRDRAAENTHSGVVGWADGFMDDSGWGSESTRKGRANQGRQNGKSNPTVTYFPNQICPHSPSHGSLSAVSQPQPFAFRNL